MVSPRRFEDILHEFTGIIETADNPVAVEAALLRQAQRMVPACRVELMHGTGPVPRSGPSPTGRRAGSDGREEARSGPGDGRQSDHSILEVPLRCGSADARPAPHPLRGREGRLR